MTFGEKLKALREERNMIQQQVAERLNIARSTVAGYESKKRNKQPSYETVAKCAKLFNVTIDYLLDDDAIDLDSSRTALFSDEEKKLLAKYRMLSKSSRQKLMDYIRLLELDDAEIK